MGSSMMNIPKVAWVLSLFIFPLGVAGNNPCPIAWVMATHVDMGCLLFNSTKAYTWEEAYEYCYTQENATLVEFSTEEQMEFLWMEMNVLGDHEGRHYSWTGGTDIGREGEWIWMKSLTPVADFLWYSNYPNGGIKQNCLSVHPSNGGATDDSCTSLYYPICQLLV